MKREQAAVDRRRTEILKKIREQGEVKVEDLANEFALSTMTVRRDLQYLEDRKLISRFYGGASINPDLRFFTAEEELALYRRLLGRFAASKISNGDTIFINGSQSALGLLDYLTAQNVHIVTNNCMVVAKKAGKGTRITVTGGDLREHVMVGDSVIRCLLNYTADKTFIGCASVNANGEFSYNIPMEIGINEVMISHTAKELYILADHTKIMRDNTASSYGSFTFDRQVTLVTDEKADPYAVAQLRSRGITVHQVGLNDVDF